MTTLSLCMIVKNEENNIGKCLESIKGIVNEIIVVDTGSTDKTIEIALSYGAKVIELPWNDDFSEARNEGIKHATGDWILFLDADEIIAPESRNALISLINNTPKNVVFNVSIDNILEDNNVVVHCNYRLWARHPEAIFVNAIHESLMIPQGFKQMPAPGVKIIHYGYLKVQKDKKGTNERNIRILLKTVEEQPQKYFMNYYVAQQYFIANEFLLSLQFYEKALDLLTKNPSIETKIFTPLIYVGILKCNLVLGNFDKVKEMASIETNTPDFYIELAGYFLGDKKYYEAIMAYEKAISMRFSKDNCSVYDSGSMTWKAYSGLGNVYQALQNMIKAEDNYKLALLYQPENKEILQCLYGININAQNFGEAEKYLLLLMKFHPTPQCYVELGNVYLNTGRVEEAIGIFAKHCDTEQLLSLKNILSTRGTQEQMELLNKYVKEKGILKVVPYKRGEKEFTVIIPTLLKSPKEVFQYALDELGANDLVKKIIVVDNTEKKEFRGNYTLSDKVVVIDTEPNMSPNHVFNYCMKMCDTKYYLLLNDDVLLQRTVINDCYNVLESDSGIGLTEILTYNMELEKYVQSVVPYTGNGGQTTTYFNKDTQGMTGWFMCGRKEHWVDIPEQLNYFFGDNMIYIETQRKSLKIVKICSKFISHLTSTTVKALDLYKKGILESEEKIFKQYLAEKKYI